MNSKITHPEVARRFKSYPKPVREKMLRLRELVYTVANETDGVADIEETTKWGEPSYIAKGGSTIRMDWKPSTPKQYALYFTCNSKLVASFKERFGDLFRYEGNRAVVFDLDDELPEFAVKQCLQKALTYRRCKDLPLLGL